MRLINVNTLELQEFYGDGIPPYATASHRWTNDETTFKDVSKRRNIHSIGYAKVKGFCDYIRHRNDGNRSKFLDTIGLARNCEWLWIDTACINKNSSAEVSEAINSMYEWYAKSDVCFAYLADVKSAAPYEHAIMDVMRSEWFTRGWTLQELLAPKTVVFLAQDWNLLGHKCSLDACDISCCDRGPSLNTKIAKITKIQLPVLKHAVQISNYDIAERRQWASGRITTRPEDQAYCLLGILQVNMLPIYGEGKNAWARVEDELVKIKERQAQEQEKDRHRVREKPEKPRSQYGVYGNVSTSYDRYIATEASQAGKSYWNTRDALDLHYKLRQPTLFLDDLLQDDRLSRRGLRGSHRVEERGERSVRRRRSKDLVPSEPVTEVCSRVDEFDYSVDFGSMPIGVQRRDTIVLPSGKPGGDPYYQEQEPHAVQHTESITPPPTPPMKHGLPKLADGVLQMDSDGDCRTVALTQVASSAVTESSALDKGTSVPSTRTSHDVTSANSASGETENRQIGSKALQHWLRPARRRLARPVSMITHDTHDTHDTQKASSGSFMMSEVSPPKAKLPPWSLASYMDLFTAAASQATLALSFSPEQNIYDVVENDLAQGEIE